MLKMTLAVVALLWLCAPPVGSAAEIPEAPAEEPPVLRQLSMEELIAQAPAAQDHPDADVIWLLDSEQMEVQENFGTTRLVRQVARILTPAGARSFGQREIAFESGAEEIEILQAVTYDGTERHVAPAEGITEITDGGSEYNMYSNYRYKVISLPSLKPGVTVELSYRITRAKPQVEGKFSATFGMQGGHPMQRTQFTLTVPKGVTFQQVADIAGCKKTVIEESRRTIHHWERQNAPAIPIESYMPSGAELVPTLVVTNWNSWEEIGAWYTELSQPSLEATETVRELAREIAKGHDQSDEKLAALYRNVAQQIRYVSLSFGIGGYRPHPAAQTLKNRFGDCKDKATLLVSALSELGIPAHLALVNASSSQFFPQAPQLGAFDHCIVAVPRGDGYLFLDPTSQTSSFGNLPTSDQDKYVLVIKGKDSHLVKSPQQTASETAISVAMDCELSETGALQGTATWTTAGAYDSLFRELLVDATPEEQAKWVGEFLAKSLNRPLTISDLTISEVTDLTRPLTITFKVQSDEYGSAVGDMLAVNFPEVLWLDSTLAQLTAASERKHPAVIGFLLSIHSDVKIRLPKGYEVMTLPQNLTSKSAVGRYVTSYRQAEQTIHMQRSLSLETASVSPADYQQLRELAKVKSKELRKQLVLKAE